MKNVRHITLALLAVASAVACSRPSAHGDDAGLAVDAVWGDAGDGGTEVTDIRAWVYDADGKLVAEADNDDAREFSRTLFHLGAGHYTVVSAVNLVPPFRYAGTGGMQTLTLSLDGPVSEAHAFCGAAEVELGTSGVTVARTPVYRMLSELAVELEGAPDGLVMDIEVTNASSVVYPALKSGEMYGRPSHEIAGAELPAFTFSAGVGRTGTFRVMPTAEGYEASLFMIHLERTDGVSFDVSVAAPVMEMSGKYLMSLKYDELQPFMRLSSCTIADWTEGWIYSGEITDPSI